MAKRLPQKIVAYLKPISENIVVAAVRIGLGYTSVRLNDGNLGLAWTARNRSGGCTHEYRAGTLGGRPAGELLEMLTGAKNALSRSIALATANALAAGLPHPQITSVEVLELVNIQVSDHVVMVGFLGPLVPRLKQTGCRLDILEQNLEK